MEHLSFGYGKSLSFGNDEEDFASQKRRPSVHFDLGEKHGHQDRGVQPTTVPESSAFDFSSGHENESNEILTTSKENVNASTSSLLNVFQSHRQDTQHQQPLDYQPSCNSYELFKQALDVDNSVGFSNFNKITIKSEKTAFSAPDPTLRQPNFSSFVNPPPDYYYRNNVQPVQVQQSLKLQDPLCESLNRLSFQQQPVLLPNNSPGRSYEDFMLQRVRQSSLAQRQNVLNVKSRKVATEDTAGVHSMFQQRPQESKPVIPTMEPDFAFGGRRKWLPYEDDLLRQAVALNGEKNWKNIAKNVPGRNHVQCLQRWKKVLKPGLIKGHWTADEDSKLIAVVNKGFRNWGEVAQQIEGRTAKQCRERWCCNLDPTINRDKWTEEEDAKILAAQQQLGNKWSTIAQMLPGRTENAIKTRAKSLQRKAKKVWTKEEDDIIISLKTIQKKKSEDGSSDDDDDECPVGFTRSSAWAKIAEKLPGRSKNAVKKRWKELKTELLNGFKKENSGA